ncbi:hypothetical protein AMATHDRAFT_71526, partial [Amanita thiersii Skay4041]
MGSTPSTSGPSSASTSKEDIALGVTSKNKNVKKPRGGKKATVAKSNENGDTEPKKAPAKRKGRPPKEVQSEDNEPQGDGTAPSKSRSKPRPKKNKVQDL